MIVDIAREIEYLIERMQYFALSDAYIERITALLNAVRPERREGVCFCNEAPCTYSEEGMCGGTLHWRDPVTHDWLAIDLHCRRCGAVLREGYAERGGDTRRIDALATWASAEPLYWGPFGETVITFRPKDMTEQVCEAPWRVRSSGEPECQGSSIRAAIDAKENMPAALPAAPGGDATEDANGGEAG